MHLDVRRQGIDIDETSSDRLARRVEFALGRLGRHVSRVSVHLADGHKHHGGSDKRCRILVRLEHLPDVVIEDRAGTLDVAIDRAVNRAGLTVRRVLGRRVTRGR